MSVHKVNNIRELQELELRLIADPKTDRKWLELRAAYTATSPYADDRQYTRVLSRASVTIARSVGKAEVIARDQASVGYFTGGTRRCGLEGCGCLRLRTLWPDGHVTWLCTDGLGRHITDKPGTWRIR